MKTIIKFATAFLFVFFSVSAMAQVADCKHDVAPYDIGRYARDVKAGKNIQLSKVPVRTVWDTNMKGGKWVTCRTTQERTIALLEDGTYYDIGCGNEIKIAMPPTPLQSQVAQSPSFLTTASSLVCKGVEECKQVKWCDDNSGWYASKDDKGNHVRRCDIPGEVSVISKENTIHVQEHTTVIPVQLPTTVKPWQVAAPVSVPPAPAAQIDLGRAAAPNVSGTRCDTQGCSYKPVAKFVSEEKADFCGIHTSDARVFKIGRHPTNGELVIADWTSGVQGKVMGLKQQATRDCDADQKAVETTHWPAIVNRFGLPNDCTVAKRLKGKM